MSKQKFGKIVLCTFPSQPKTKKTHVEQSYGGGFESFLSFFIRGVANWGVLPIATWDTCFQRKLLYSGTSCAHIKT